MSYNGIYDEHYNTTDTLYARPIVEGAWTAVGIKAGTYSVERERYEFLNLEDFTSYDVCIQAGAEPAEGDFSDAMILSVMAGGEFPVTVLTPTSVLGSKSVIPIVQGDDYTELRKLPIEIETEADLVDQYIILAIERPGKEGFAFRCRAYLGDDDKQYFDIDLSSAITATMALGDWSYLIRIEAAVSKESRIAGGVWRVTGFVTPTPILGLPR